MAPRTTKPAISARVKVWLEADADYVFGHGISRILQAVEQTGSMKEAARVVGKSYRHVWARIKSAEKVLQRPLVETRVGGEGSRRSHLTEDARTLVREYNRMRDKVIQIVDQSFSERIRSLFDATSKRG